jgi:hypothetical protein
MVKRRGGSEYCRAEDTDTNRVKAGLVRRYRSCVQIIVGAPKKAHSSSPFRTKALASKGHLARGGEMVIEN